MRHGLPDGAAHRDPKTGIVTMHADKCVGCKYCIVACPYNARFINEETKVADNCDFCLHTRLEKGQQPACVEACKYDALVFGDLNDPNSYINKLLAVKDSVRIRPNSARSPACVTSPLLSKECKDGHRHELYTWSEQGIAWPWPIAVYLFLAGISGGAVAVASC